MGLVKFYYGNTLPKNAEQNPDILYFVEEVGLYKGDVLIADVTDTVKIQQMINESLESLGNAIKFLGHSSAVITDGGKETPIIAGETISELAPGDVVLYEGKEFIWVSVTGEDGAQVEQWELFGDEGSYVTKTALDDFKESLQSAENGFVVKKAEEADKAAKADEATKATNADHAGEADSLALSEAVGSGTQPVYFSADGLPVAISHTIEADVPSDAKFTDTVTEVTETGEGNAVTAISATDGQLTVTKGATFAEASTVQQLNEDLSGVIDSLTWTQIPEEAAE